MKCRGARGGREQGSFCRGGVSSPVSSELPESIILSNGERDEIVHSYGQIKRDKKILD